MKNNKILLLISKIEDLEIYEKLDISNFLFPLKDYSIGYNSFTFNEISKIHNNCYVLLNRLLTDRDIDNFLKLDIPKNIKGFIIEDIGLYEELKNRGYTLINYQNHLNNNYKTINYWLKYYDSLVINADITKEEIDIILNKTTKPLVLYTYGYPMVMYSRRTLVTNFYKFNKKPTKNKIIIKDKVSNSSFFMNESEYGTAVFNSKPFYYNRIFDDTKIMFYLINSSFTKQETIKKIINGDNIDIQTEDFLDKKTIYRIGDIK